MIHDLKCIRSRLCICSLDRIELWEHGERIHLYKDLRELSRRLLVMLELELGVFYIIFYIYIAVNLVQSYSFVHAPPPPSLKKKCIPKSICQFLDDTLSQYVLHICPPVFLGLFYLFIFCCFFFCQRLMLSMSLVLFLFCFVLVFLGGGGLLISTD